jgi:capsular polysaccharide transport system ATP-binding protein
MAIDFDCFLIDEIIAVGDQRFSKKCQEELFVKRADRAFVVVSHHPSTINEICDGVVLLSGGRLLSCESP